MRPEIVVLCGSTRFSDEIIRAEADLTLQGKIVLGMGVYNAPAAAALDELHRHKIDLADSVLVINPGGYIGESTRNEIAYATARHKPVSYTSPPRLQPAAPRAPARSAFRSRSM